MTASTSTQCNGITILRVFFCQDVYHSDQHLTQITLKSEDPFHRSFLRKRQILQQRVRDSPAFLLPLLYFPPTSISLGMMLGNKPLVCIQERVLMPLKMKFWSVCLGFFHNVFITCKFNLRFTQFTRKMMYIHIQKGMHVFFLRSHLKTSVEEKYFCCTEPKLVFLGY